MSDSRSLTALIHREGELFVALCPQLDIASQGTSIEDAKAHLREAVELFLETADSSEIDGRLHSEIYVSQFEVPVG